VRNTVEIWQCELLHTRPAAMGSRVGFTAATRTRTTLLLRVPSSAIRADMPRMSLKYCMYRLRKRGVCSRGSSSGWSACVATRRLGARGDSQHQCTMAGMRVADSERSEGRGVSSCVCGGCAGGGRTPRRTHVHSACRRHTWHARGAATCRRHAPLMHALMCHRVLGTSTFIS